MCCKRSRDWTAPSVRCPTSSDRRNAPAKTLGRPRREVRTGVKFLAPPHFPRLRRLPGRVELKVQRPRVALFNFDDRRLGEVHFLGLRVLIIESAQDPVIAGGEARELV